MPGSDGAAPDDRTRSVTRPRAVARRTRGGRWRRRAAGASHAGSRATSTASAAADGQLGSHRAATVDGASAAGSTAGRDEHACRRDHAARRRQPLRQPPGVGPVAAAGRPRGRRRASPPAATRRAGDEQRQPERRRASRRRAGRRGRRTRRAARQRERAGAAPSAAVARSLRPKPRESIAAASSTDRSSAPSSTGIATPRSPRSPRVAAGRAAGGRPGPGRRPRPAAGEKLSATTTATPTSYSAPGTDRSSRLRVGQRVGRADAGQHRGQLQPGVDRGHQALERSRRRRAGRRPPSRAASTSGRCTRTVSRHRRAEQHREDDPDRDHDQAHPQVEAVGAGPRRVGCGGPRRRSRRPRGRAPAAAGSSCGWPRSPGRSPTATRRRGAAAAGAARASHAGHGDRPPGPDDGGAAEAADQDGADGEAGPRRAAVTAVRSRSPSSRRRAGEEVERLGRRSPARRSAGAELDVGGGCGWRPGASGSAVRRLPRAGLGRRRGFRHRLGVRRTSVARGVVAGVGVLVRSEVAACGQIRANAMSGGSTLAAVLPDPPLGVAGVGVVRAGAAGGVDPAARSLGPPPVRPVGVGAGVAARGQAVELADLAGHAGGRRRS